MQKMVKSGFRGERKRNPHPVHILSYSETSPKERGCNDEERVTNGGGNVLKTSRWLSSKGEIRYKSDN